MRKHSVLAVVAATVGVLAVAGGAFAASQYVITSTHQIKPSVLTQLRGHRGPRGYTGARGSTGAIGATGATGMTGPPGIDSIQDVNAPATAFCASGSGSCDVVSANVTCPSGMIATGGSANVDAIEAHISTFVGGGFYGAVVNNEGPFGGTLNVTAVCVSGQGLAFRVLRARSALSVESRTAALVARLRAERVASR